MNAGGLNLSALDILNRTSNRKILRIITILSAVVLVGAAAWIRQIVLGLGQTGMNNSVTWGLYITNFIFFIGISHAGILVTAVLRLTHAEWRRPITRAAEAVTVFALIAGSLQLVFDVGRPGRILNVVFSGRLGSPLLWDLVCITVYLVCSIFYLYLPLIPDLADLRAKTEISGRRRAAYALLSRGWEGTPVQKQRLEKAIGFMAVFIIPIAISVHSVVSWVFGMTVRPMWHSTILGPYFITGALFSGIATVILIMAFFRGSLGFKSIIQPIHFRHMGSLLLLFCGLWFYFTLAEHLTVGYGGSRDEFLVFRSKLAGGFSAAFWSMIAFMAIAFILLLLRRRSEIHYTTAASAAAIIGIWIERFLVVVPTLTRTMAQGYKAGPYVPTLTEWLITAGSLAGFLALLLVFSRKIPIISAWEMNESEEAARRTASRVRSYLPDESSGS